MTEDLSKVVEALKQESTGLKGVIDQLSAQKEALSATVNDILQANINLKANGLLLEKHIIKLNQDVATKDAKIVELSAPKENLKK